MLDETGSGGMSHFHLATAHHVKEAAARARVEVGHATQHARMEEAGANTKALEQRAQAVQRRCGGHGTNGLKCWMK
jgi:uncharacterized protein YqjF (DUF2071 family)